MIIEQATNKEYHANGTLSYTETIGILSKSHAHLYENRRIHPDGYEWVRVGYNAKFNIDGKLMWQIHFDSKGVEMKVPICEDV